MNAWTTLLGTDNYLGGVLTLEASRKKVNSQYPLVVICFDNLSEETLMQLKLNNIPYQVFPELLFDNVHRVKDYRTTLGKFYAYQLQNVEKFCFIDADSFFVQNIDYILEIPISIFFFLDRSVPDDSRLEWVDRITGCVFSDFTSDEKFDFCVQCKNTHAEDETVLNKLAQKQYGLLVSYRDWTMRKRVVLYHETACSFEYKFWNTPNFEINTFLDTWLSKFYSNQ